MALGYLKTEELVQKNRVEDVREFKMDCHPHPCFENKDRIRTRVKIIAMVGLVINTLIVGILTGFLGYAMGSLFGEIHLRIPAGLDRFRVELALRRGLFAFLQFLVIFYFLFKWYISYQLWQGAKKENEVKCRMWRSVRLIELVIGWVLLVGFCIGFVVVVQNPRVKSSQGGNQPVTASVDYGPMVAVLVVVSIVVSILQGYVIWIVSAFMNMITRTRLNQIQNN